MREGKKCDACGSENAYWRRRLVGKELVCRKCGHVSPEKKEGEKID